MSDPQSSSSPGGLPGAMISLWRKAHYPDLYCWYVLASTLDIICTFIIIELYKGWEVNKIAARIFDEYSWPGMIALKYATVLIVVLVCESVGSRRPRAGRALAIVAVVIGALPVLLGSIQIGLWAGMGHLEVQYPSHQDLGR